MVGMTRDKQLVKLAFRAGYRHGAFSYAGMEADDEQADRAFEVWFERGVSDLMADRAETAREQALEVTTKLLRENLLEQGMSEQEADRFIERASEVGRRASRARGEGLQPGDRIEDWEGDQATVVDANPVRLVWDCLPGAVVTPDRSFLAGGWTKVDEAAGRALTDEEREAVLLVLGNAYQEARAVLDGMSSERRAKYGWVDAVSRAISKLSR